MGVDRETAAATVLYVGLAWPHYIRTLDENHIPAMLALQETSGDGQVLDRTAGSLKAHFAAGHTAIGVFHRGKLVGQSLIRTETVPATGVPQQGGLRREFMKQSLIGGVIVAREARGQGLGEAMIGLWLGMAQKDGADIAHARVRTGNQKSWEIFLRKGLSITGAGPSPDHPHERVYFMHKPLKDAFDLHHGETHAAGDRGDIGPWLDRGYIATGWNPHKRTFAMARAAGPQ
jgi:ribosomal protein S18 acetylase RimI-like enzyme